MIHPVTDPANMRRAYASDDFSESAVGSSWFAQFQSWFSDAVDAPGLIEPNAMAVATVQASGRPSVRTVLMKALDERGVVFYTNYDSAKAHDLAANAYAAAVFGWLAISRQVRFAGPVEKVTRAETEEYFARRPRGSQLGAWSSPQSRVLSSRAELQSMVEATERRFADGPIPAPPNWGGYLLRPESVEFWQGREDRLHDRLRFSSTAGVWTVDRLAP